jgi:anti-sigma-K factor RskA
MDSSPKDTNNPDATLRTPDGDVTLRAPAPPVIVPAGDVTIRQPTGIPDADATVRMPSQSAARTAPQAKAAPAQSPWWAWTATSAFAASSAALLILGIGAYSFFLHSKVTFETAHRQQAEENLEKASLLAATMLQELTQTRQELNESTQQLTAMASLQDTVTKREMDVAQLRMQLDQKEKELLALYKTASPKNEMLAMLQSATVRVLPLAGTDAAKSAGGLILYDPERGRAFLYAFNMPALQRGNVYQLWAITTKPLSAGTFSGDTGRKSRYIARSLPAKSGITKFAVSVEPEGGRPQPTGAIYLHGSL